jgi:hypothetical protein
MRRLIASSAAEAEFLREDMSVGEIVAIAKALAGETECHVRIPLSASAVIGGGIEVKSSSMWKIPVILTNFAVLAIIFPVRRTREL